MPRTYRYSYWALAAGLVTLVGLGDAAACALLALQPGKTAPAAATEGTRITNAPWPNHPISTYRSA